MLIRNENNNDVDAVRRLLVTAFEGRAEADLVSALRQSGDLKISLVAEENGEVAGCLYFSDLSSPEHCLALAPLAVAPGWRKQGVGSGLIKEGLKRAVELGGSAVFVLGEPDYYRRFGFSVEKANKFISGYPKSHFMILVLDENILDGQEQHVIYPSPFSDL